MTKFDVTFEAPKDFTINRWKTRLQLIFKPNAEISLTMDASNPETTNFRGSNESNFLAQYREEHFTEEAFTKEPNEFQRLFELKKNEDQNI
jgi:hypothetical protein